MDKNNPLNLNKQTMAVFHAIKNAGGNPLIVGGFVGLNAPLGFTYLASGNRQNTIINVDTRKRKYPVVVSCDDGKEYKAGVDFINYMYLMTKKED